MRVLNFSAGPAVLPEPVLEKAKSQLLDYKGTGMSVMEMSHRSAVFGEIISETEATFREIMGIPESYKVLFLQGGASTQFAMVPLNLLGKSGKADYVNTGNWSKKAIQEAQRYGSVRVVASSEDENFTYIPRFSKDDLTPGASYLHITVNNTIYGTRYTEIPETGTIPLVADMSSNILSEVFDVSRFALIYAGAQKNVAPAGLTIVILKNDLIGDAIDITPTMLRYKTHADKDSMFNTPPCWCIYMAGLSFAWIKEQGGVAELQKRNERKAGLLYDFLDNSSLFTGTARREDRSLMNVTFTLPSDELTKKCVAEAESEGMVNLKGHRSVGGLRASIFNAMPEEGVKKLVRFLNDFEKRNS
jgi:phosphoserine aminotransferase